MKKLINQLNNQQMGIKTKEISNQIIQKLLNHHISL